MSDSASQFTSEAPLTPSPRDTAFFAGEPLAAPPTAPRLRLWPGVFIIAAMWIGMQAPVWLELGGITQFMAKFYGPMAATTALLVWWVFFSRLRWNDRLLGVAAFAAAVGVAVAFCHPTFGFMLLLRALPVGLTAWVLWLLVTPMLNWPARRIGLLVVFFLVAGYFDLLRMDGVDGSFGAEVSYRWEPTAEDKFRGEQIAKLAPTAAKLELHPGDWPAFRGAARDGRLHGVRIATDWKQNPPKQLWKHGVGPGWSSFAVVDGRLFTQEQRDEQEVVVCYDADTGAQAWVHSDTERFTEPIAGPGPRATPTFHEGKIYALGASGKLNCLDAATGKPIWTRDIKEDGGVAKVPTWGFSSSPLVAGGVVTVFAGGEGKAVLGYDPATGDLKWYGGEGTHSYSSTHPARIGGVEQVLMLAEPGLTAFDPTNGNVLWCHEWEAKEVVRCVQPALVGESDVLIGTPFNNGTKRLHIAPEGNSWYHTEAWTTKKISPYFNDLVVYGDSLYGFEGNFFTCVGLADGAMRWKERGYSNGQVLLLADQGLLLVLTEKGEVALVKANSEKREELGRFAAIEGKTWNHPVIAHGKLFVRNGKEAACFQLTEKGE